MLDKEEGCSVLLRQDLEGSMKMVLEVTPPYQLYSSCTVLSVIVYLRHTPMSKMTSLHTPNRTKSGGVGMVVVEVMVESQSER